MTEAAWLEWLEGRAVRPLGDSAWADRRLVVVAPHPDDEVLMAGGLAAQHAAAGGAVTIVAVTDGEASHPDDPAWPAARLAPERTRESSRGLLRLGLARATVVRLGFPDGDVARHAPLLGTALERMLRPCDLVVTTWRLDGHPDHEATGAAVAAAARIRRCELLEAPVWMWHWCRSDDTRVPWDTLRSFPLPDVGQRRKREAIAEHATQLAPRGDGAGPVLDDRILARSRWPAEYFFVSSAS